MDHRVLLKGLLAMMKQDALAREIGVSQATVSRWLKDQKPGGDARDRILEVARERGLIGDDETSSISRAPASDDQNLIPEVDIIGGMGGGGVAHFEQTSEGNGISFVQEVIRDHWRLPDWVLSRLNVRASHLAVFPSRGDSMEPTIGDGDVVFIDTRHRVPSPPGIYALADEFGGVVVKRLEVVSAPSEDPIVVSVGSDNPRHQTRNLPLSEISIIGRYVGRFSS